MAIVAKSPNGAHRTKGLVSPRISMRTTFTTRSPALNHLLPATEVPSFTSMLEILRTNADRLSVPLSI